jgi:hypothetical protein
MMESRKADERWAQDAAGAIVSRGTQIKVGQGRL